MNPAVLAAQIECEKHLNRIAKVFKPGARLTLIVRTPGNNEADFVLTLDDEVELRKLIERRFPVKATDRGDSHGRR